MSDNQADLSKFWDKAIKVSSPVILRGAVGCAFFTYGIGWIPDIPTSDLDLWLRYGFFGADGVSALTLLYGMITGK